MALGSRPTFEQALEAWRKMDKNTPSMHFPYDPTQYTDIRQMSQRMGARHCPVCGFPQGEPGWVRFDWPVGHAYFGMAFECPRCHVRDARRPVGVLTAAVLALFA